MAFFFYFFFFQQPPTTHLLLQVSVVLQVSQTPLVQPRGHLIDVAAQVIEQLRVAVARSQAQSGFPGQVDGVEDVLVPGDEKWRFGVRGGLQVRSGQPPEVEETRCFIPHLL